MVSPHICMYKQDTVIDVISPKERLFATLRNLVSELIYDVLKFERVIAEQTREEVEDGTVRSPLAHRDIIIITIRLFMIRK